MEVNIIIIEVNKSLKNRGKPIIIEVDVIIMGGKQIIMEVNKLF